MNNIKWEDGAVCFAGGKQWDSPVVNKESEYIATAKDFQLNEIRQGDYIEASELDTEQKYNDAIEVFGLFGFEELYTYGEFSHETETYSRLIAIDGEVDTCSGTYPEAKRKLTHPQLMAIGKLKRVMIERDSKSGLSNKAPDLTPDIREDEWTDKHYNNFYQLNEEDIKSGKIKVDAYFVNRMWRINSWEDTGAGFHILKTFPRIANNKNTLKRELVALKKQVDILCELHGVDGEDLK